MNEETSLWQGEACLRCLERREETQDTASFTLAVPPGQSVDFLPGQFISLGVPVGGTLRWRAYSIASSPTQRERLVIAVRRVAGGLVSNWLLDHFRPGMSVSARSPYGGFTLQADDLPAAVALFSAGCGITPMMSMARWLLETQPGVTVHFFHSARDEEQVIFSRELHTLAAACPRLKLHLFLSRPQGLNDWYSGRIDATRLRALLPESHSLQAFLCGQEGYMAEISAWLSEMGVPEAAIRREHFAPAIAESCVSDDTFRLKVPDFGRELDIARGESLLEVLESAGLPIIGACRTGVCGSCKCRLVAGKVSSSSTGPLSLEAQAAGYVLACSSQAESDLHIALA